MEEYITYEFKAQFEKISSKEKAALPKPKARVGKVPIYTSSRMEKTYAKPQNGQVEQTDQNRQLTNFYMNGLHSEKITRSNVVEMVGRSKKPSQAQMSKKE